MMLTVRNTEKENKDIEIAPETQKLNWYVLFSRSRLVEA